MEDKDSASLSLCMYILVYNKIQVQYRPDDDYVEYIHLYTKDARKGKLTASGKISGKHVQSENSKNIISGVTIPTHNQTCGPIKFAGAQVKKIWDRSDISMQD